MLNKLLQQSQAMPASARFPLPTILLAVAALVALASIGYALTRPGEGEAADDPAARDWRVVGWAYAESGDSAAAAEASRKAARLEPENAENWSSLGEALQTASTTVVPEAAQALAKAIALDPSDPRARYFLAVQSDLSGDHQGAVRQWLALLKDTPSDAPWRADLQRTIERTAARHRIPIPGGIPPAAAPAATAAIPGPSPEQLAAASSIPPGEQDAMVKGMVDRLAARLAKDGRDADGWMRLMRSHMVLGDTKRASAALRSALGAFAGDPATQARLRSAAAELGVPAGG